jgi:hypothetical protein
MRSSAITKIMNQDDKHTNITVYFLSLLQFPVVLSHQKPEAKELMEFIQVILPEYRAEKDSRE